MPMKKTSLLNRRFSNSPCQLLGYRLCFSLLFELSKGFINKQSYGIISGRNAGNHQFDLTGLYKRLAGFLFLNKKPSRNNWKGCALWQYV